MEDASPSRAHRRSLEKHVDISPVDNSKRLEWYYGVATQILQQADKFEEEGDVDRAYIFYRRFCHLAVERIPAHNSYKDKRYARDKSWLAGERRRALSAIEALVDKMDHEYRLEELSRRMLAIKGSFSGGLPSPAPEAADPSAPEAPYQDDPSFSSYKDGPSFSSDVDLPHAPSWPLPSDHTSPPLPGPADQGVGEPSAPLSDFEAVFSKLRMEEDTAAEGIRYYPEVQPAVPPPALPPPPQPVAPAQPASPAQPRGAARLRPLLLASGLVGKFAKLAEPNTNKGLSGVETCGVLAGVQEGETLRLTTLIIPKQTGTSDTVSMTHEEELFEYCHGDGRSLIVLGWIHTHPRQSCFMSSVDVHTHCGFQTMLPEAVAIVVAPTHRRKQVGVFRLTEPHGLQLIQRCTLRGFHTHPSNVEIYHDHQRVEWRNTEFRVVDLRDKR